MGKSFKDAVHAGAAKRLLKAAARPGSPDLDVMCKSKRPWVESKHPRGKDGKWVALTDAVARVAESMGIDKPVVVESSGKIRGSGMHDVVIRRVGGSDREEFVHRVVVNRRLGADEASKTIYHELTHAAQFDRRSRQAKTDFAAAAAERERLRRGPYEKRPEEVEAREAEKRHEQLSLAKPAPALGGRWSKGSETSEGEPAYENGPYRIERQTMTDSGVTGRQRYWYVTRGGDMLAQENSLAAAKRFASQDAERRRVGLGSDLPAAGRAEVSRRLSRDRNERDTIRSVEDSPKTWKEGQRAEQWQDGRLIRQVKVIEDPGGPEVRVLALYGPLAGETYMVPREYLRS